MSLVVCRMWPTVARLVQPQTSLLGLLWASTSSLPLYPGLQACSQPLHCRRHLHYCQLHVGTHSRHCLISPGHAHRPLFRCGPPSPPHNRFLLTLSPKENPTLLPPPPPPTAEPCSPTLPQAALSPLPSQPPLPPVLKHLTAPSAAASMQSRLLLILFTCHAFGQKSM